MNEDWKTPVHPRDATLAIGLAFVLVIGIGYGTQSHLLTHTIERRVSIAALAICWTLYLVQALRGVPIFSYERLPGIIGFTLVMVSNIVTPSNPWQEWLLWGGLTLILIPTLLSMRSRKQTLLEPDKPMEAQEGVWPPPPRLPNEE